MKRLSIYMLAAGMAALSTSCSDFLDTPVLGQQDLSEYISSSPCYVPSSWLLLPHGRQRRMRRAS